jgi:hypothetical protein
MVAITVRIQSPLNFGPSEFGRKISEQSAPRSHLALIPSQNYLRAGSPHLGHPIFKLIVNPPLDLRIFETLHFDTKFLSRDKFSLWGRRGTLIDYWWESQRERDH